MKTEKPKGDEVEQCNTIIAISDKRINFPLKGRPPELLKIKTSKIYILVLRCVLRFRCLNTHLNC